MKTMKKMTNEELLLMHMDLLSELEAKYAIPMRAYTENLKTKYGESPTQKQSDEIAINHNKAALLENIVSTGRSLDAQIAAFTIRLNQLDKTLTEMRIISDGQIRTPLLDPQRNALKEKIDNLLAFLK